MANQTEEAVPGLPRTRAERLDKILRRKAPKAVAFLDEHGVWPRADQRADVTPDEAMKDHVARLLADPDSTDDPKEAQKIAETSDRTQRRSPYEILTTPDGGRQIKVTSDDGDVWSGVGRTTEEALAALEAKLS